MFCFVQEAAPTSLPDPVGSLSTDGGGGGTVSGNVGTALYIAPEVCQVKRRVKLTSKVDMYSLGELFFALFV